MTAVAKVAPAQVPDLVRTPALEITAEDVALPRIYVGQFMSEAVKNQLAKAGDIFAATGQDDPDPTILYKEGGDAKSGVLFHVVGLRKGKSISDGGELVLFDYNDPDAPEDAWVTYTYTVVVPEYDTDVPCKLLLTRTGKPAALQINTVLKKNEGKGPVYATAFRLTTAHRENQKGEFFVPRVQPVEADADHIKIVENIAIQMSGSAAEIKSTGDEPAI